MDESVIGMFDSGVGGLTVYRQVRALMPGVDILYLADRAHAPYGEQSLAEVATIARRCTEHLLAQGAETIVVACNTASAAALHGLRGHFPSIPFVGMEPALKPATAITQTRVVGVLATAATFQGELFASLQERYADGVEVINQACPGWAAMVETGRVDGPEVEENVRLHLEPVLEARADVLVLGCTHYPFLLPVITRLAGSGVSIIDPSAAVAVQVGRVTPISAGRGETYLHTTGDPTQTSDLVTKLTGMRLPVTHVTCQS
jgi:glutamate racemase